MRIATNEEDLARLLPEATVLVTQRTPIGGELIAAAGTRIYVVNSGMTGSGLRPRALLDPATWLGVLRTAPRPVVPVEVGLSGAPR